jgi:Uma2 family endonuclease
MRFTRGWPLVSGSSTISCHSLGTTPSRGTEAGGATTTAAIGKHDSLATKIVPFLLKSLCFSDNHTGQRLDLVYIACEPEGIFMGCVPQVSRLECLLKFLYFGQLIAMGGASREHNLIVGNAFVSLHAQLRGKSCEVYSNDMRVHIPAPGLYTYPDIAALGGEPVFEDDQFDTLLNPSVIMEVLSASTEAYDRGAKFAHYRSIVFLQAYVLIAQGQPHIELFERGTAGRWVFSETRGIEGRLEIEAIGCILELSEGYERTV